MSDGLYSTARSIVLCSDGRYISKNPRRRDWKAVTLIMKDYAKARANMVESQLRPNKITDPAVIAAFAAVRREDFVPAAFQGAAYADEDLPLGPGRYLTEPMILARLLQEALLEPDDRVLLVGCGTGYGCAVLARIVAEIVSIECDAGLAAVAVANLSNQPRVTVVEGALDHGCAERGPYDAIVIDGAMPEIPQSLMHQLKDGGRLAGVVNAPTALRGQAGVVVVMERIGMATSRRVICDAGIHPLPVTAPLPAFSF